MGDLLDGKNKKVKSGRWNSGLIVMGDLPKNMMVSL
jgi:hypothetical protein